MSYKNFYSAAWHGDHALAKLYLAEGCSLSVIDFLCGLNTLNDATLTMHGKGKTLQADCIWLLKIEGWFKK